MIPDDALLSEVISNEFDQGLDGLAWIRRQADLSIFKRCLAYIGQDLAVLRETFRLPKAEIAVYVVFTGEDHRVAQVSYRAIHRRRYKILTTHPIRLDLHQDRVVAVQWG